MTRLFLFLFLKFLFRASDGIASTGHRGLDRFRAGTPGVQIVLEAVEQQKS